MEVENKWTNTRRTGRVPNSILLAQFVGHKCSSVACKFIFCNSKQVFACKSFTLPVGISTATVKLIKGEFKKNGLELSDGCDNKQRYIFI
jgi:hypothetical protein